MNKFVHAVETPAGSTPNQGDRVLVGTQFGVANGVGGGAGLSVTVAVAMPGLPANYTPVVNPGQDATWFVTGKTKDGFNVTLTPRLATNTLAAGTFDVAVFG